MSRRAVGHPPMKLAARQWHKRRPCAEEAGLCPLQWQPGRLPATFGGRERVTHSRAATALGLRRNTPSGGRTLSPSRPARSLWLRHPPHRLQPDPAPLPDDHRRGSGAVASAAAAPRCRRPPPGAVEAPRGCLRQPPLPPVPPPAGGGGRASCVVVLLCPTGWPPPDAGSPLAGSVHPPFLPTLLFCFLSRCSRGRHPFPLSPRFPPPLLPPFLPSSPSPWFPVGGGPCGGALSPPCSSNHATHPHWRRRRWRWRRRRRRRCTRPPPPAPPPSLCCALMGWCDAASGRGRDAADPRRRRRSPVAVGTATPP